MFLHQSKNISLSVLLFLLIKLSLIICFDLGDQNNYYNYKAIYINKKIIYIGDDENDFIIYEETKTHIGSYSEIIDKKDIIKIDDNYFVITGFGSDGNFKYIKMDYQNLGGEVDVKTIETIKSSNIEKYNFLCISLEKCFFTSIDNPNNKLIIYRINATSSQIEASKEIQNSFNSINNFQCDFSSNGKNFFCVANGGSSNFKNKYYYGNIENGNPSSSDFGGTSIFSGNVKKINDYKYLVCYEEGISDPYIKCLFYNIENDRPIS